MSIGINWDYFRKTDNPTCKEMTRQPDNFFYNVKKKKSIKDKIVEGS